MPTEHAVGRWAILGAGLVLAAYLAAANWLIVVDSGW